MARWETKSFSAPIGALDPDAPLPSVCLVVILSHDRGVARCFDCASGHVSIGRDEGNDLVLQTDYVSRQHAIVERRNGRWMLVDKSRNGTACNGVLVDRERPLEDGDRIQIGLNVLVFLCRPDSVPRDAVIEVWKGLGRDDALPFTLAVLRPLVASHVAPVDRVRASFDAVDAALRFFTATLVGSLCETPGREPEAMGALREALHAGVPWERAAFDLAALVPEDGPVGAAAGALRSAAVRDEEIRDALASTDRLRALVFQKDLAPTAYSNDEALLREVLGAVLEALQPLWECRLVSVARIVGFGPKGQIRYDLHEHRGPCELFPVISAAIRAPLMNDWCYLRVGGDDATPIPLAPFVRYGVCTTCGRKELGLAETVVLGPPQAGVRVRSVTTGHTSDALVPEDERLEAMYRAFSGERAQAQAPTPQPATPPPIQRAVTQKSPTLPVHRRTPKILFLGVSAKDMPDVEPEEELRAIEQALEHGFSVSERRIVILPKIGVHAADLQKCLNDAEADVIHVSAHGSVTGEIYLRGEDGQSIALQPADLVAVMKALEPRPCCLVLSACFSAMGAEELRRHAGCVVGMKTEIGVRAAATFCSEFYRALASGESVQRAFDQGCAQLAVVQENSDSDARTPVLLQGTSDPALVRVVVRSPRTEIL